MAFLVLVAALVFIQARKVQWAQVGQAIKDYRSAALIGAMSLAALSYFVYSCYDLMGRHYIDAKLSVRKCMSVAFVSYAFNQNFGSIVGALAFRFRLYSRFGLNNAQISQILALSMLTNWAGYFVVAGGIFASGLVSLPENWMEHWRYGRALVRVVGFCMLGLVLAYVTLCAKAKRRTFTLRGREFCLPSLRMTLLQLSLSMTHWPLTASVIYVLLQQKIEFATVLGTLMLSSVAAVLTHIPAGIGVLETVFVSLLGHRLPHGQILAALLVFRAVYHLIPLCAAGLMYFGMEIEAKKQSSDDAGNAGKGVEAIHLC